MQGDRLDEEAELRWQDATVRPQESVAHIEQVLEHVLVEQLVAHLLVEDHVDRFRRGELAAVRLHELDVGEAVVAADLAGDVDDVGVLDCVHLLRAGAAGHESEQARAGTEVDHDVARPHVAPDATVVRLHADGVAEHLLVLRQTGEVGLVHQVVDDAHQPIAGCDSGRSEAQRGSKRLVRGLARTSAHPSQATAAGQRPIAEH